LAIGKEQADLAGFWNHPIMSWHVLARAGKIVLEFKSQTDGQPRGQSASVG
jgi:hypothetical protein